MKNKKVMQLFAIMLAASMAATNVPATVYAGDGNDGAQLEDVQQNGGDNASVTETEKAVFTTMTDAVKDVENGCGKWAGFPSEGLSDFGTFTISQTGKKVTVTGTAKKITGFTGFSNEENEQSGHYVPWQFEVSAEDKEKAVFYLESVDGTVELNGHEGKKFKKFEGTSALDTVDGMSYFDGIYRIDDRTAPVELVVDWDGEGIDNAETYTIDFTGVKFESNITITQETESWDDVTEAKDSESGIASKISKDTLKFADDAAKDDAVIDWYKGTGEDKTLIASGLDGITEAGEYTYIAHYNEGSRYTTEACTGKITIGVDLSKAMVTVKNNDSEGEPSGTFGYTGKPIALTAEVKCGENNKDTLDSKYYGIRYTTGDAEEADDNTEAFADAGSYKLWVVPSAEGAGSCYNSKATKYTIAPTEVIENNYTTYLSYENITEGLTYNGSDQSEAVKKKVTLTQNYSEVLDGKWSLKFKKSDSNTTGSTNSEGSKTADEFLTEITDAGTYDVYVEITGNIATKDPVKIGTAKIDQYQTKAADITVKGNTSCYNGKEVLPADMKFAENAPLNDAKVTFKYKQVKDGNGKDTSEENSISEEAPVNAGTYQVYIEYKSDSNCTELPETDANAQIVISKADAPKPTVDQYVVKKDKSDEGTFTISDLITKWAIDAGKDSIDATVTAAGDYYASEGLKYDKESKAVKIILDSTKTTALNENTKDTIHVVFKEDSFNNYKQISFDIPVVITAKDVVGIKIADAEKLSYTGSIQELKFTVSDDGGNFTDITEAKTAAEIESNGTDSNAKVTVEMTPSEIKNAGDYKVHVVYEDDSYFGETTQTVTVSPKKITETKGFENVLSLDTSASPTYNFTNQIDTIKSLVKITDTDGVNADDYDIIIKKGEDEVTKAVDAGDYDVYINFKKGNYTTTDLVKLGTVSIGKATGTLTVTADSKGTPTIKIGNQVIGNDDKRVTIQYLDTNDKVIEKPTTPGTYKVKVTFTDDANYDKVDPVTVPFTIPSPSTGDSTGGSTGSSTGTETKPGTGTETKPDGTKTETTTETKPDGTKVETTTETKPDGTKTESVIETKPDGTKTETTTETKPDGTKTESATETKPDGSKTETTSETKADGSRKENIVETAADGSVKTTETVTRADGSAVKTEKETETNAVALLSA